jgi:hypothetical protein
MKNKLATPFLIACAILMAMVNGTGVYQHMFDIPKMLSSSIAFAEALNNNMGQPQKFWIPLHGMIFITLVLSLIFNWKNPARKKLVLTVFLGYLYISVISIPFAQQLFAFQEITDASEFTRRTNLWILLSWHRVIIGLASVVLLMIAISRPIKIQAKSA